MKKGWALGKKLVTASFLAAFTASSASALTLDAGTAIYAIDGDADANVTVQLLSTGGNPGYTYGYFLNGGSDFTALGNIGISQFTGGDIIDFALRNDANSAIYTLSGDAANDLYNVTMLFGLEVDGSAQMPADWTNPYYFNVNILWHLPSMVNGISTDEYALNYTVNGGNDGVAPVPEPGTLLLLGIGFLGLAGASRMRTVKK